MPSPRKINKGEIYVFRKLEDREEGTRYNYFTKRYKKTYVGEKCVCLYGKAEPYTFLFADGAMWALNACELGYEFDGTPLKKKELPSRRKKCICIETGKSYNSYGEAALDVGTTESNIRNAVNGNGRAKGYHWRKLEGEEELEVGNKNDYIL